MINVLFVCHGNICRSPMAEYIFKELVRRAGREKDFYIESAATHDDEIVNGVGNPIYPPAQRKLRAEGIPFSARHARLLTKADYGRFDRIFFMDEENEVCIARILGGDPQKKISKLPVFAGTGNNVSDPWFTNDFDRAYDDIFRACEKLVEIL